MATKRCCGCKDDLPLDAFGKNRAQRDGLQTHCKGCRRKRHQQDREKNLARSRRWQEAHRDEVREKDRQRYAANPEPAKARARRRRKEKLDECRAANRRYYRSLRPEYRHHHAIKSRARKRGIDFHLTKEDTETLLAATHCPLCGVEMEHGPKGSLRNKSIDRFIPTGPYDSANCVCLCVRCNTIKSYGTWEEHVRIATWVREALEERGQLSGADPQSSRR